MRRRARGCVKKGAKEGWQQAEQVREVGSERQVVGRVERPEERKGAYQVLHNELMSVCSDTYCISQVL